MLLAIGPALMQIFVLRTRIGARGNAREVMVRTMGKASAHALSFFSRTTTQKDLSIVYTFGKVLFVSMHRASIGTREKPWLGSLLVAAAATARLATAIGGFERVATATARYSIGVVNREASAHQAINIIDLAALDVAHAHLINQDIEAFLGNQGIALLLLIKGHPILKTRATAARDEDAQTKVRIILLSQQLTHFVCRGSRHANNACLNGSLLGVLNHNVCLS
jgi:hypothetical protein